MKEHLIIYADDERHYRNLVAMFLDQADLRVIVAESGNEALDLLGQHPDTSLLILDVMMSPPDGWETCRLIRSFSDIPVLMITALGDEQDEIFGLENGADDYIAKPFSRDRLLSRVRALIRRGSSGESEISAIDILKYDESERRVFVDGIEVLLTPKEYSLLGTLVRNRGYVLERSILLDRVWGYDYEGGPRTLDTHIKSLRGKLGEAGKLIKTVRNLGYRIDKGSLDEYQK